MLTEGLLCAQCTTSLGELFTVSSCSSWSQLQTPEFVWVLEYTESFFPSEPLGVTFPWPRIPPLLFPKLVFLHPSHIPPLRDAFFTPQLEESPALPFHLAFFQNTLFLPSECFRFIIIYLFAYWSRFFLPYLSLSCIRAKTKFVHQGILGKCFLTHGRQALSRTFTDLGVKIIILSWCNGSAGKWSWLLKVTHLLSVRTRTLIWFLILKSSVHFSLQFSVTYI